VKGSATPSTRGPTDVTDRAYRSVSLRAALAAALAFGTCGCDQTLTPPIPAAHAEDAAPVRGGVLQLSSFADIRALDPANISDGLVVELHQLIFAGLVDYDENGDVVPELAESVRVEDAGKTYRFVLRQHVLFHTGEELTAKDVKRSVERALSPTAPNPFASFYSNIAGFEDFQKGRAEHLTGVSVDGTYEVSFHLAERDATFLPLLAMQVLRPVCPNAGDTYSDTWKACGAGPFMLSESGWERGQRVTLVRHPGYFKPGLPYLDGVTMTFFVNFMTEKYKLARGEIDILRELQQPDLIRFQSDPRWLPFGQYESVKQIAGEAMNTEMPPFDNIELRRAVAAAIDREHYRLVKPSNLLAADQPIPLGNPFHVKDLQCQKHDLAAALEHMKKAGYAFDPQTGEGGYPTPIPYLVYRQGLLEYTAQVLAQDLAKIGIRLDVRVVNYPTYLALQGRRKTTPFAPAGWNQDFPDPSDFTDTLFHSRLINDEDSSNYAFYSSPRADDLMDRARREIDPTRRHALYRETEELICSDAPWAFTYYYRWYDVHQPYVKNYREHPVWTHNVRYAWLDRATASARADMSRLGLLPAAIVPGALR
jgi:ABC-type transport system substrate-binding protein